MAKALLIVESPAKARTIGKYLGPGIEVKASVGHIRDLPVNRLGVDLENQFEPEYITIAGKQKIIADLKKAAKDKDVVYLAPDPDREGEAIAWHIAEALQAKDRLFLRVLFHELTPKAIRQAIEHPEEISVNRFESQQARRILDRLVGYQLSPLLWDKVKRGLSAGRVQSVALRIIVERERQIFAFAPVEYWSLTARLSAEGQEFDARLFKKDGRKIELANEEQTQGVIRDLDGQPFVVGPVAKKERKRHPLPPFTTSQLQQAAFSRLRFPAAHTMRLAQQLYEGVELGSEGSVGLITYMRTDSVRVAADALTEAREVIQKRFGPNLLPAQPQTYQNKKGVQDAHEAIRPSSSGRAPEDVKRFLSPELYNLYELIWRRFVASQMKPAIIDQTTADIDAGRYQFRATGSVIRFKGFLSVYDLGEKEDKEVLPPLEEGRPAERLGLTPKQHFTQPPPRFTEATLVKELEENGIGRPSTYATIISTLRDKAYVESNRGQLRPTELGFIVNDLLVANFPQVMDVEFTAGMETHLDEIEEGRIPWREVLGQFNAPFENDLAKARLAMTSLKREGLPTDVPCDRCGANMTMKYGRNGPFLSCSKYPECKNAADFKRDENGRLVPVRLDAEATGESCPQCGLPMARKKGKYGEFLACTGYPDCKTTRPLGVPNGSSDNGLPTMDAGPCPQCGSPLAVKRSRQGSLFIACTNYPKCKHTQPFPTGVACPRENCDGQLTERSSSRGVFWGCSNYPKCRFTLKHRPIPKACPDCQSPYLLEAPAQDGSGPTLLKCPNKACGYETPA